MQPAENLYDLGVELQSILLDIVSLHQNHIWESISNRTGTKFQESGQAVTLPEVRLHIENYQARLRTAVAAAHLRDADVSTANQYLEMCSDFRVMYDQAIKALDAVIQNTDDPDTIKEYQDLKATSNVIVNGYIRIICRELANNQKFLAHIHRLGINAIKKYNLERL